MNFIELCKATARESGTLAGLPSFTTVAGATGRVLKIVNWVRDAWIDIQNERLDWLFRQADFSKSLTVEQAQYTGASWSLEVAAWLPDTPSQRTMSLYDPDIGQSAETEIRQISYAAWKSRYDRGEHDANRPTDWAIAPNGSLCLGPKPDAAYTLRGSYRMKAQRLEGDTDTPIMPEDFHMVIVAEALRLMGSSDEEFAGLADRAMRYERLRNALVHNQTPDVHDVWGSPLA